MRDASGQMYMRNRYYDPSTGQFTQTDPIGLAGGLNAYGFGAGDPVSYSDPYGLTVEENNPEEPRCDPDAEAERGRLCPVIVKAKAKEAPSCGRAAAQLGLSAIGDALTLSGMRQPE